MTPSIDARLDSMIRAMIHVILPALNGTGSLVEEQGRLLLGHLNILRDQIDSAPRLEEVELIQAQKLALQILNAAKGETKTLHSSESLSLALESSHGVFHYASQTNNHLHAILSAIEDIIRAAEEDGATGFRQLLIELVLEHGRQEATRARSLFIGANFERESISLPLLGDLLKAFDHAPQ